MPSSPSEASRIRTVNRILTDRYLEIEAAVRQGGEREQNLRALIAADILHAGPNDRKTVLSVTRQIREFFAKVKKGTSP